MTTDVAPAATRSLSTVRVRPGARVVLACLVGVSAVVRSLTATGHSAIGYLPDEYIYSSISRSIAAHGRPLVRGSGAHFPALLEPLLAAPLWAVGPVELAYRLVQIENAVFVSVAAIPVYALARKLDLGTGYSLLCAAFALAIPDLVYSTFILSDPLAYPLALGALFAGVCALSSESRRWQVGFVALAGLTTLARAEYIVLAPAFVCASIVLDRRAFLRRQSIALSLFAAGLAFAVALGPSRVVGFYDVMIQGLSLNAPVVRWAGLDLFLLALAGGIVLVPGAIVGLAYARERVDRAFAAMVVFLGIGVMVETALYDSSGPEIFRERYLFVLLPLVPIAFGLYLKQGRRARLLVTTLAASVVALAATLPLSGYAVGRQVTSSPLLCAYTELETHLGTGDAALIFALVATAAAVLAAAGAWTPISAVLPTVALLLVTALSVGAVDFDRSYTAAVREQLVAPRPSWVDDAHLGAVSAIETQLAPPEELMEQMFWNRSIDHELLLGSGTTPTDAFATEKATVARDGRLIVGGKPLRNTILFQGFAVTPVFGNAALVGRYSSFSLWHPTGTPRLRLLDSGRYWDGWLALRGTIEVWPTGRGGGTVSFTLSLPRSLHASAVMRFGGQTIRVSPGRPRTVRIRVARPGPSTIAFASRSGDRVLSDQRFVSVRSTTPIFTPA